jgi:hypothetical protein
MMWNSFSQVGGKVLLERFGLSSGIVIVFGRKTERTSGI